MTRRLLAALFATALAFGLTAYADEIVGKGDKSKPASKADSPEIKVAPKVLIDNAKLQQDALKRQFDSFKQKLAVLAGRLENGDEKDKEKAKALKAALKLASERGTENRFDSLIRNLTLPNAA